MPSHIDKLINRAETIKAMLDSFILDLKETPNLTVGELMGITQALSTNKSDSAQLEPNAVFTITNHNQNTDSRIKVKGTKDRLLELLSNHKEGLDTDAIKRLFMETWNIQLTTDQVASSVTYLRGLKKIQRSENGRYFVI